MGLCYHILEEAPQNFQSSRDFPACLGGEKKPIDGKPGRGQSSVSGTRLYLLRVGVMSTVLGQNPAKALHQSRSSNRNTFIGITPLISAENPNRHL